MKIKTVLIIFIIGSIFQQCHAQPAANSKITTADTAYTRHKASADGTGKFYIGREIAQVMGAGGSGWLERASRQQDENADLAIEKINLSPGMVVADIGAGTGYYSFRIAAKMAAGKLYAVEIQDELISYLQQQKKELKDTVVQVIKGSTLSPNLPDNSTDLVFMVDVYHELEFPHEILQSIRQALKTGGKLLLIEYRGEDPAVQIKPLHKTTVAQLNRELNANGFQLSYQGEFLPIQHFLLYEKK